MTDADLENGDPQGGKTADVSEHFDGVLVDNERSPAGYKELIGVAAVLVEPNTGRLVITGRPNELHNCDRRGCGSFEHKIAEIDVDRSLFEPIRNHTEAERELEAEDRYAYQRRRL